MKWAFLRGRRMLRFGLAMVLALGLTLGLGWMARVWSQGDCETAEALQQCIERRAVNHANAGTQMYQGDVYEEFKDNSLGWDRTQILNVYEEAFNAKRERLASNFFEQLPQGWTGWITAGLMFFLLIFRDVAKEKVTEATRQVGAWVYQKFAGNPLLLNWALQRYRKALQESLQHLPTPFKVQPPLPMAEVYVPLKVKEREGSTQGAGLELDVYRALGENKRLMVLGAPGSGKSVLLRHVAHSYGEGKLSLPGNPIPVRLELNTLQEAELDRPKLIQKLVAVLDEHDFPNAAGFLEQGLGNGQILLLLDGLDEVSSSNRSQVVAVINGLLQHEAKDCPAVITCRTQVYRNEFDLVLERNVLEVVEFSDVQMRRFLQAWKNRMPPEKSVEQLMQTLQDRPRIKGIARNPLMLTFITYLYIDPTFVLPYSRAEFYEKATGQLLELRDLERNIFNTYSPVAKRQVLRKLALSAQDVLNPTAPDRRSIPHGTVLQVVNQMMPDLNLDSSHTEPILQEIIDRSGLLLPIDGRERYQFAHLTLQEFFAAAALQQEPEALIRRFEADPAAWREVVKLWCGLAGNSTAVIERVYQREPLAGFECLADAQEVEQGLAERILQEIQGQLVQAATEETWAQAFGAVAADYRPRGQQLFTFLKEQLSQGTEMVQKAAANGLSMSNLPRAAQVLASVYEAQPERVGDALVRMGDVAVESLRQLAEQGKVGAVDELWRIQTPEAAKALVTLLWLDDQTLSGRAAWRLAALLSLGGVEEEMTQVPLSLAQSSALDWIWTPFLRYLSSPPGALPVVTGQVAALLSGNPCPPLEHTRVNDLNFNSHADPRLLISLCTIVKTPPSTINAANAQFLSTLESWLENPQPLDRSIDSQFDPPGIITVLEPIITPEHHTSPWGQLFQFLKPSAQGTVIHRWLTEARWPDQQDWEQLLLPVQSYVFAQGNSYRSILAVAGVASLGAVIEMIGQMAVEPVRIVNGLLAAGIVIIGVFWLSLWEGIETCWEPNTFLKLGIQGVVVSFRESWKLYRGQPLSNGIQALYKGIMSPRMAVATALIVTINTVIVVTGTGTNAWVVPWTVAGAAVGAGTGAMVVANFGVALRSVPTSILESGVLKLTVVLVGIVASVTTGEQAPAMIATWGNAWSNTLTLSCGTMSLYKIHQSQNNQDTSIPPWQKSLAFFAFPYFCWFPLTLWFSFWGLHRLYSALSLSSILALPTWLLALLTQATLLVLCTYLWRTGQAKERRARNPLQGILDPYYPQYKQPKP